MTSLRNNPPASIGGYKIIGINDYLTSESQDIESGVKSTIDLPKSNVLYFELENDSWCCARPSGTEPKIKFYMGVKGTSLADAEAKVEALTEAVKANLD